nr:hypothetical protein [Tanacetum cinerariifolium]
MEERKVIEVELADAFKIVEMAKGAKQAIENKLKIMAPINSSIGMHRKEQRQGKGVKEKQVDEPKDKMKEFDNNVRHRQFDHFPNKAQEKDKIGSKPDKKGSDDSCKQLISHEGLFLHISGSYKGYGTDSDSPCQLEGLKMQSSQSTSPAPFQIKTLFMYCSYNSHQMDKSLPSKHYPFKEFQIDPYTFTRLSHQEYPR